ncbi:MAG: leucyl aminopeptidase [Sphingomonadaceae bacterium]
MHVSLLSHRPADATSMAFLAAKGDTLENFPHGAELKAAATLARFDAEAGSLLEISVLANGIPRRVMVAGVGAGAGEDFEKAGSALAARLLTSGESRLVIEATGRDAASVARLATSAVLRSWRFDRYRTKLTAKQKPTLDAIAIVTDAPGAQAAWDRASAVIAGVSLTRELVSEPANVLYPESFVERCKHLAAHGIEIEVLDDAAMRALGMGALLGVGQGSARPSAILSLRWNGLDDPRAPVVFVGKGVTFDTGGISIKPAAGMEDMKWDMGGAGAVAGAMLALAMRKAKAHVVGICALVENMPDGNAQRPGDVVTSMSGQTIEVINTDAEGRLILCDAMTWVQQKYQPKVMIDLATLTGAMIVALGNEYGGLFSNDDALAAQLSGAGAAVGDALWRFPLGEAYNKLIDSQIADMKNVGPREAGSITAAQFLQRFVEEGVKWAHLDIAGMVWASKPATLWDKGATGYGVRLLDRFIADNHER